MESCCDAGFEPWEYARKVESDGDFVVDITADLSFVFFCDAHYCGFGLGEWNIEREWFRVRNSVFLWDVKFPRFPGLIVEEVCGEVSYWFIDAFPLT